MTAQIFNGCPSPQWRMSALGTTAASFAGSAGTTDEIIAGVGAQVTDEYFSCFDTAFYARMPFGLSLGSFACLVPTTRAFLKGDAVKPLNHISR